MADKRHKRGRSNPRESSEGSPRTTSVRVRLVPGQKSWELIHPPCARERADDVDEVRHMIEMGEYDVALDELRWLLNGCGDCIEAHRLLGELALLNHDARLARGHFGYAYEIGIAAIDRQRGSGPYPYERAANQAFLECGKGLARCLSELEKPQLARQVLERLLVLDPSDPLGAKAMLAELSGGSR